MAVQLFTNNAASQLSGTLPQGGTTLVCSAGQGSRFPTPTGGDYFYLTIYTKDVYAAEENIEIVKVTARATDVMTVVRDIEDITGEVGGFSYNGGTTTVYLEMRWTAGCVDNLVQQGELAAVALSGAYGDLSGTPDLSLKANLASPTFTGPVSGITKTMVGLGSVDNTADTAKPISTLTQTALNGKEAIGVAATAITAERTAVATLTNKTLTLPVVTGYTETVYTLAGTVIDPANGTVQTKTLAANTTFTESIGDGQSVVLMLNPATYNPTWPTTPAVSWVNAAGTGAAPTLKASAVNVIVLWQVAGVLYGNWIGSL